MTTPGIHHVTAFARSPRENIDFYSRVLGLRTIKITVNYDDPATYHLYYADRIGTPGTVLTFFPHPDAPRPGRIGSGQATVAAFAIPNHAIDCWTSRLDELGVAFEKSRRGDDAVIAFTDPDGLRLELVSVHDSDGQSKPWEADHVIASNAIRGFHSVAITVHESGPTIGFLREQFGFRVQNESPGRKRLHAPDGGIGSMVDVIADADTPRGSFGPGTVHHVAWRAADLGQLEQMRRSLIDRGINVTEIKNRNYFRSIYFREPGGVIFEIATDGPGFTIDEPEDQLGSGLMLPPWMEDDRKEVEAQLPSLDD